ncbi:hypothetical protein WME75_01390 [Sorangium sp. So ce1014]|uniref:hypothetical protein n=1 Tax=Sorangium sp. So ce1014 TaxID=3133326 RepID=UPI003F60763E
MDPVRLVTLEDRPAPVDARRPPDGAPGHGRHLRLELAALGGRLAAAREIREAVGLADPTGGQPGI